MEQRRINNLDRSTYQLVKCDFEPLVSEEEWYKCEEVRHRRMTPTLNMAHRIRKSHCKKETKDLWTQKLRCGCGASFRKNRWHKNKGKDWSYGYQCYNQLNNGSAKKRREAGVDDEGYCDNSMIADWKLELIAKFVLEDLWRERKNTVTTACRMIRECFAADPPKKQLPNANVQTKIERTQKRIQNLIAMRTDGEISAEEFKSNKGALEQELQTLQAQMEEVPERIYTDSERLCWEQIETTLNELIDFSYGKLPIEIIKKLVRRVLPQNNNHFRLVLNLDNDNTADVDLVVEGRKNAPKVYLDGAGGDKPPVHMENVILFSNFKKMPLAEKYSSVATQPRLLYVVGRTNLYFEFTVDYEAAKSFRKANGDYLREFQWTDLTVEVYI